MNFVEAIKSGFNNYINFSGRAQRSAFWWWVLFINILVWIAVFIDGVVFGGPSALYGIAFLAILLPTIAVTVRRLHDLDRSGWWLLLALTGIGGIVLLIWYCMTGTNGPNQYGPNPL